MLHFYRLFLVFGLSSVFFSTLFSQTCNLTNENFDTSSFLPLGWQTVGGNVGTTAPFSAPNHFILNATNENLTLPTASCPGEICYHWRASGTTSNFAVYIQYSSNNGVTWNTTDSISLTGVGSPIIYTQHCSDIPENVFISPFSNILVRFLMPRRIGGSFYVDDICLSADTCLTTATKLAFSVLPQTCILPNSPTTIRVCGTDNNDVTALAYNNAITLNASSNGGGTIAGTTTLTPTQGCADFSVNFSTFGSYELSASSSSLPTATFDSLYVYSFCEADTLQIMFYNLLNFPNGRNDCGASNIVIPARWNQLRTIAEYVHPDVLMVCELQDSVGADSILTRSLMPLSYGTYQKATFIRNTSTIVKNLNNFIYFNTEKLTFYSQDIITTPVRDISHYILYQKNPCKDTVFMDFYVTHLKAGTLAADSLDRIGACTNLQNYCTLKGKRNAFFAGDFNFYSSNEGAYQVLLTGSQPFVDVLNPSSANNLFWDVNPSFATWHTQSPRDVGQLMDCGANGGINSRFDFSLMSQTVFEYPNPIRYIEGTYIPLANNGTSYNDAINVATNTSTVPMPIKQALFEMSDHLPVLFKARIENRCNFLILPLTEIHLDARIEDNYVALTWVKVPEAEKYVIEKSFDNISFKVIQVLKNQGNHFSYKDFDIENESYFYRIKVQDLQGNWVYSNVEKIQIENLVPIVQSIEKQLIVSLPNSNIPFQFKMIDVNGKIMINEVLMQSSQRIDLSHLAVGLYFCYLFDGKKGYKYKIAVY